MSEWQDISTAPKDGTRVDLWIVRHPEAGYRSANALWEDGEWVTKTASFTFPIEAFVDVETGIPLVRATHWMPLPKPPTPLGGK